MAPQSELQVDIPHLPKHAKALAEIPSHVHDKWKAAYEQEFRRVASLGHDAGDAASNRVDFQHQAALKKANELLKVEEPLDHEAAFTIPDWQVMKRQEIVGVTNLPAHARRSLRGDEATDSGRYLHVYTTDGREYFFRIPKQEPK